MQKESDFKLFLILVPGQRWEEVSQAQRKKIAKLYAKEQRKTADREKKEVSWNSLSHFNQIILL